MRQLLPSPAEDADPFALYAADDRTHQRDRPWVLANMITSLDGATHVDGLSGGLASNADRITFRAIRAVADVILVAAGTARSEQYHPVKVNPEVVEARLARGQSERPRLAILTRHLDLDLDGELFVAPNPPILLTTDHAPEARVRHAESRTTVVQFPGNRVDVAEAVRALGTLGAKTVLTEGGPTLIGQMALAGVIDELCLSLSPLVVGGDAARVTDVVASTKQAFTLRRVLEEDSMLLLRYVRSDESPDGA